MNKTAKKEHEFTFILLCLIYLISPWINALELDYQKMYFAALISITLAVKIISFTKYEIINATIKDKIILGSWFTLLYFTIITNLFDFSISKNTSNNAILIGLIYTFVFILMTLTINSDSKAKTISKIIVLTAVINVMYSTLNMYTDGSYVIVESNSPWNVDWIKEVRGTFSYKNQYATYLSISLYIAIGLSITNTPANKKNIIISLIIISILIFGIVKTSSRGSLITHAIMLIVWVGISFSSYKKIKYKYILTALSAIGFVVMLLINSNVGDRLLKKGLSANGRDLMQNTVVEIIKNENFLFGIGLGNYGLIQEKYKQPELGFTKVAKKAHNDYLEQLVNIGLLGYAFLGLIVYKIKNNEKKLRLNSETNLYFLGILYFLVHSFLDFNANSPIIIMLVIFCIHMIRKREETI